LRQEVNEGLADLKTMRYFQAEREAVFVRRPNRFLIIARDGEEELRCHCPNPGRLMEFLFPGTPLILEKHSLGKTAYRVAAIRYKDTIVPLYSAKANEAAETFFLAEIIPGLESIRREYPLGHSRFDFLCNDRERKRHLVEVKACSLIEYGTAMFPDAPSQRALKHLHELAALSAEGFICHVLFVIVHSSPRVFIPNLHTDPAFAETLSRLGRAVYPGEPVVPDPGHPLAVHGVLLRCDARGEARAASFAVPVDLSQGPLASSNGGSYLILLEIPKTCTVETGALGELTYERGWYVYAGSAKRNLSSRVHRHLQKEKKIKHWHIDYLTPWAGKIRAYPFLSYRNLECLLAGDLEGIGGRPVERFGSSDCSCRSHLFYFPSNPLLDRSFVDLIFRYRHVEALDRTDGTDRTSEA